MAIHYTNDMIFDVPDKLIDATPHIFILPEPGPSKFSLVVDKKDINKDETLQSYEAKILPEMEESLPKFVLNAKGVMKIADHDAGWFIYTFMEKEQWFQQALAILIQEKKTGERQLFQITATARGEFTEECKQDYKNFLASITLRKA